MFFLFTLRTVQLCSLLSNLSVYLQTKLCMERTEKVLLITFRRALSSAGQTMFCWNWNISQTCWFWHFHKEGSGVGKPTLTLYSLTNRSLVWGMGDSDSQTALNQADTHSPCFGPKTDILTQFSFCENVCKVLVLIQCRTRTNFETSKVSAKWNCHPPVSSRIVFVCGHWGVNEDQHKHVEPNCSYLRVTLQEMLVVDGPLVIAVNDNLQALLWQDQTVCGNML